MGREDFLALFKQIQRGEIDPEEALLHVQTAPYADLGYANIDLHRGVRQGFSEVIYGQHKTPGQILGIVAAMYAKGMENILITRLSVDAASYITANGVLLDYHEIARLGVAYPKQNQARIGSIVVATAGTSDMPISEEAALTAEIFGNHVTRAYDIGVAGLHRLVAKLPTFTTAHVVIAVAGMEGALASVIGGLVNCPVIAVPTSVGYGANFGGLSALLSMLNSCASGVSVVNIDNGFGAAYVASMINRMSTQRE